MDASADTLRQFIDGVKLPELAVPEFLAGTTFLKRAAYKSEREVRIAAGGTRGARAVVARRCSNHDVAMYLGERVRSLLGDRSTKRRRIKIG